MKKINKNLLNKIIIGAIVVIVVVLAFLTSKDKFNRPKPNEVSPTPTIAEFNFPTPAETQKTIDVSGVTINNFFIDKKPVNNDGDVDIKHAQNYDILYLREQKTFLISILDKPFDKARSEAEQGFLTALNITKEQSCLLPVTLTTPSFVNPDQAGIVYKLSFCQK